ncbi:monocarboxylate transporter 14-like [Haliotis rufescens]|uniref:monocarboxylate transporter 14-like n=1 Tax=Haliotis rufescens TaxID=6454 RepID=UPI00201ECD07|nr:monocarboxylate transporter 14-like [Haliotis rufescens]XP_046340191.2 monocarboxylate transporter 14-like [Haliotis rufescens]XP_046340192.2 monocarboxylate transporter 14-like [Haliotis rufescens]XP_046340193.2 monocarboxylate transporter 14-like [Haliotis rufescens]XP_046340194.2 monocarboxylate transporter 14-like [Haliotis rufescens]
MEDVDIEYPAVAVVHSTRRSKYAWVVLLASFLTQFLNPAMNYAVGVFHVALLDRFHGDVTLTAWVGSVNSCMFSLAGPVAALVANMLDCRTCVFLSGILGLVGFGVSAFVTDIKVLFVTYAFIAGLGQALAQVGSMVVIGYYFPRDTALASGIAVCGTALGIFIHPPLVQKFIEWYALPGAFLLVGALVSHCCIFGLIMRPSSYEVSRKAQMRSGRTTKQTILFAAFGDIPTYKTIISDLSFIAFMLSTLLLAMGYSVHILFLPDYMNFHGATLQEASLSISTLGIGSFISRLLLGVLSNDKSVGPELIYSGIVGITAVTSVLLPLLVKTVAGRLTYGALLGIYTGGVFALQSTISLDIAGVEHFAIAYGAVMFFLGIGYLIGPPIAGSIFEMTNNYSYVFVCSSVMFFASVTFGFLSMLGRKTTTRQNGNALDQYDLASTEDNSLVLKHKKCEN